MDSAFVIGNPIEHSLSPKIWGVIKPELNYQKQKVLPEELSAFVGDKNHTKFNVTLPHKEAIIPLLHDLAPEAREIGAVNVVFNGKGFNTDYLGVIESLKESGIDVKGKNVLIYGAGGATRGVHYALKLMGAESIYVYNRTPGRAPDLGIRIDDPASVDVPISLLVNTLNDVPLVLPPHLTEDVKGFDVLYYQKNEPFPGITTVTGLSMLIWQAIFTAEIWYGIIANKSDLKRKVECALSI